jgi:hypothetical protein
MFRLRALLLGVPAVLALSACGGGTTRTVTVAATATHPQPAATSGARPTATAATAPTPSIATLPDGGSGTTRPARPAFPARTAADVLALALQRPAEKVRYDVASPALTGTVDLVQRGGRGVVHVHDGTGETWVGVDVGRAAIGWVCRSATGGGTDCRRGDPEGAGARTAAAVARLIGAGALRTQVGPALGASGTNVGVDRQVGQQVSCLATNVLRLCATREGIVTVLAGPSGHVTAQSAGSVVADADLAPPTAPR